MNVAEVLTKAKELIAAPARWTTGAMARGRNCKEVDPRSQEACSWCTVGAVYKVASCVVARAAALDCLAAFAREGMIPFTNDNGTHAEVMQMFDSAIKLAAGAQ